MTAEIMINKVVITAEAKFDYEEVVGYMPMPKTAIKNECENYIDNMQKGGRLLYDYYFRVKYLDENSDKMLMLFFYKGERFGKMQTWELSGICEADDWTEDLEYDGNIRNWLKTKITDYTKDDWVVRLRAVKIFESQMVYSIKGIKKEIADAFMYGTDKEIAEGLPFLQNKRRKWNRWKQLERTDGVSRKKH